MAIQLRYIGDGAWLPGVPASDHEVEDVAFATELIASGLYERADGAKKATKPLPQGEVLPEPDDEGTV